MFLERKIYLKKIEKELNNDKILFLVGARQVGKTSLLKSLIDFSYIKEDETLFLYGDKLAFMGIKDFMSLENFIYSKIDKKNLKYLIIDEAQYIENIGLILKIFYDTFKRDESNIKIIASGSGSLEVFRGITDSLIGRKKIINVYPLSFLEFLEFKNFNSSSISLENISDWQIKELSLYLDEFLQYGSYPEVVFTKEEEEKLEVLNGIYSDYIYKDIGFYLKTDEIISFDKFLKYIGYGVCSTVKIDKIVKDIGINRRLVEKFIFLVENTFILNFIPAFTKNKQKEVSKHKKIYFTDLGFLRKVIGINNILYENKGKFIENFVFLELLKYKQNLDNIYYYQKKNGSEIDFIIENEFSGKIKPIEIKSGSNDNIPIIFKSFIFEYDNIVDKFYVINKDIIKKRKLDDKEVFILSYLLLFKEFSKYLK